MAGAAEIAGLEEKYFSTYFHSKTGVRFRDWLANLRVSRAMEIIRDQDRPITRIAFDVGFRELRTFERAFRRFTGMTPQDFKNGVKP